MSAPDRVRPSEPSPSSLTAMSATLMPPVTFAFSLIDAEACDRSSDGASSPSVTLFPYATLFRSLAPTVVSLTFTLTEYEAFPSKFGAAPTYHRDGAPEPSVEGATGLSSA